MILAVLARSGERVDPLPAIHRFDRHPRDARFNPARSGAAPPLAISEGYHDGRNPAKPWNSSQ
jgi:hypothetical protein